MYSYKAPEWIRPPSPLAASLPAVSEHALGVPASKKRRREANAAQPVLDSLYALHGANKDDLVASAEWVLNEVHSIFYLPLPMHTRTIIAMRIPSLRCPRVHMHRPSSKRRC
jgi:hypothetical protein